MSLPSHFIESRYIFSTFSRAQGVLRKNFRLERMLGFSLKQRIGIRAPMVGNPTVSTRWFRMDANVIPCRGSALFESFMDSSYDYFDHMKSTLFSDVSGVFSTERNFKAPRRRVFSPLLAPYQPGAAIANLVN